MSLCKRVKFAVDSSLNMLKKFGLIRKYAKLPNLGNGAGEEGGRGKRKFKPLSFNPLILLYKRVHSKINY
jgi:hypothetical protein